MSRARPEEAIHRAIVTYLRFVLPSGFLIMHPRNGGKSLAENARAKAMGTVRGWPDLEIHGRDAEDRPRCWFLEVKAPKAYAEPHQRDVHDRLFDIGWSVAVVRSVEDTRLALKAWNVPTKEVGQ